MSHLPDIFANIPLSEFEAALAAAASTAAEPFSALTREELEDLALTELLARTYGELNYLASGDYEDTEIDYWVVDADGKYVGHLENSQELFDWLIAGQNSWYMFQIQGTVKDVETWHRLANSEGGFVDHIRSRYGGTVPPTLNPADEWRQSYLRTNYHVVQVSHVKYPLLLAQLMSVYRRTLPAGATFSLLIDAGTLEDSAEGANVTEASEAALIPDNVAEEAADDFSEATFSARVIT
jgi:hypothetical protein